VEELSAYLKFSFSQHHIHKLFAIPSKCKWIDQYPALRFDCSFSVLTTRSAIGVYCSTNTIHISPDNTTVLKHLSGTGKRWRQNN